LCPENWFKLFIHFFEPIPTAYFFSDLTAGLFKYPAWYF